MVEVERVRYSDALEREKIRAMIKARKEKQKEQSFESEKDLCLECDSKNLVHDYEQAELVYGDCGLVIDADFVDEGPEWRAFDHDQRMKLSHVGAPTTYSIHDKGLSTMIDWRNRDSYGKSISLKNRAQLYRLRKWQRRIRVSNATERNLAFAFQSDSVDSAFDLMRMFENQLDLSNEKL